jgi:hypothetical protein
VFQLDTADPMLAVAVFIALLAGFSLGRIIVAWLDMRSLRREEELNGMRWGKMR